MKNTVIFFKDLLKALSLPVLYVSVAMIFISVISPESREALPLLFSFAFPSGAAYYKFRNSKYALPSGIAAASGSIVLYSISGNYFSIVQTVILSFLIIFILKKAGFLYGSLISILLTMLTAYLLSLLDTSIITYKLADFVSGSGAIFGVVNNVYELFCSDKLGDLIYNTGVSKSVLINGEIISGVKSIFAYDSDNEAVSVFLTGKYYESVFLTLGMLPLLIKRLNPQYGLSFLMLCIFTVLMGDNRLFSLCVLIYSPFLYMAYLLCIFISYILPPLLNISIGFVKGAGIIELISNIEKPLLFLLSGAVLAILTYFSGRLVLTKIDFQNETYYPKKTREIISALGGMENIKTVKNGRVYVENPNLINILKLDCDVRQNVITLAKEDYEVIKKI